MNVMLADSIDGGIFAILVLLLGGGASVIALIGLVPARQGNRAVTFLVVSPAIIAVIAITGWLGYGCFTEVRSDPEARFTDLLAPWVILAGLPVITSGTTLLVLWRRRKRQQQQAAEPSQ
jgi:LPXTG-motif cell wall-anchored protein